MILFFHLGISSQNEVLQLRYPGLEWSRWWVKRLSSHHKMRTQKRKKAPKKGTNSGVDELSACAVPLAVFTWLSRVSHFRALTPPALQALLLAGSWRLSSDRLFIAESRFRLSPRLQGLPLIVPGRPTNLAIAVNALPACCFYNFQACAVTLSPLLLRARYPRVFGLLQGIALGMRHPLLPAGCRSCLLLKASTGSSAYRVCWLLRTNLDPHGCWDKKSFALTLQGLLRSLSFWLLPVNPLLCFYSS